MHQVLGINQIVVDSELYPRHFNDPKQMCDWQTVWKYSEAFKSGAKFPPIRVAYFAGKHYLTDGLHRIEMYKQNKIESVECDVWQAGSRKEIFVEAVKANVVHGRSLSSLDRAEIIVKLKKMGFSPAKISEIVSIPADKVNSFVANRITNSVTGEEIILKGSLKELVGTEVQDDIGDLQSPLASRSAEQTVEEMLTLLELDAINFSNPSNVRKCQMIRNLIDKKILGRRRK